MNCIKCKGTNFIKSGTSFIVPTTTYLLCECGNVMMKDSRFGDMIIPTPESGKLAEVMISDAARALGLPEANFVKTEEEIKERENALINLLNNLVNDEDECDVCDECEEDEVLSDETVDDFVEFVDKIIAVIDNPLLEAMWEKTKANGNIHDLIKEAEESSGFCLKEIMNLKQKLIDNMPEHLAQGENKEDILAKLTVLGLGTQKAKFAPTDEELIDTLLEEIFDNTEEIEEDEEYDVDEECVECEETCDSCLAESNKEEVKSYVILEKDAGWRIHRNKTKEQISAIINRDNELDTFAIFEIKPVKVTEKVNFTIE